MTCAKLPPIICSVQLNEEYIGSFDNPFSLVDAIDIHLGKIFISLDDLKEDEEADPSLVLWFSVVNNSSGYPEPLYYDEESIKNRTDILALYDTVIENFREMLLNSCSINSRYED